MPRWREWNSLCPHCGRVMPEPSNWQFSVRLVMGDGSSRWMTSAEMTRTACEAEADELRAHGYEVKTSKLPSDDNL